MQFIRSILHLFKNIASDSEESDTSIDSDGEVESQNWSNPTDEDVFTVRALLLHFVPLELANVILDTAQYWPCISAKNTRYIEVLADSRTENNAAAYYLVTPVIPIKHSHLEVEMVKFNLSSCDQGWGGSPENNGTYNGHTWFEVGIMRGVSDDSVPPIMLQYQNADDFDANVFGGNFAKEIVNPLEDSRRWKLQYNMHVSSIVMEHEVIWTKHDIINDAAEALARTKGARTGRGFMKTLAPGDRIALVARAQYPGWANNVYAAKIEVFYSL